MFPFWHPLHHSQPDIIVLFGDTQKSCYRIKSFPHQLWKNMTINCHYVFLGCLSQIPHSLEMSPPFCWRYLELSIHKLTMMSLHVITMFSIAYNLKCGQWQLVLHVECYPLWISSIGILGHYPVSRILSSHWTLSA